MKQLKLPLPIPEGFKLVFRPWITLKDSKKLFAAQVGKRAFPLIVPVDRKVARASRTSRSLGGQWRCISAGRSFTCECRVVT